MTLEQFSNAYENYYKVSVQTAFRLLQDFTIAEDIAQEVFFHLYEIWETIDVTNERKLRSLVVTATVNKTRDYLKKSSKKSESCRLLEHVRSEKTDERLDPEQLLLSSEWSGYRREILDKLRVKNRESYDILIKVVFFGLPADMVAREYGISRNTLDNRIMRARKWLQEELKRTEK